jgi:large subunit ribosomal protein L22
MIRGHRASSALEMLKYTRKKSAGLFYKLVESAVANAEHKSEKSESFLDIDDLIIKTVFVDQGPTLRRFRPRARGMANRIHKKTSHLTVVLESLEEGD